MELLSCFKLSMFKIQQRITCLVGYVLKDDMRKSVMRYSDGNIAVTSLGVRAKG